eukprot:6540915-Prymnesium_polylepis.1
MAAWARGVSADPPMQRSSVRSRGAPEGHRPSCVPVVSINFRISEIPHAKNVCVKHAQAKT